jgi:long-chain acyl-CoA synthetase
MVPTMIGMLLSHEAFRPERLAGLRTLTYGASPMPSALLDRLLGAFPTLEILQGYGMTESSAVLTVLGAEEHRAGGARLRSAGRPIQGVVVSVQDDDGKPVPSGAMGEVCARGGNFMREYWNQPDATAEAFRDGWYHTGDAGYLDEGGYVFLVDRVKDMIVTGGENVATPEIERVLYEHEAVLEAAVIGMPNERWGEVPLAVVVLRPGFEATAEDLMHFCADRLGKFKVPKDVQFRDVLPRSPSGKVLKREIRLSVEQ